MQLTASQRTALKAATTTKDRLVVARQIYVDCIDNVSSLLLAMDIKYDLRNVIVNQLRQLCRFGTSPGYMDYVAPVYWDYISGFVLKPDYALERMKRFNVYVENGFKPAVWLSNDQAVLCHNNTAEVLGFYLIDRSDEAALLFNADSRGAAIERVLGQMHDDVHYVFTDIHELPIDRRRWTVYTPRPKAEWIVERLP